MKKFLSIILITIFLFALSACGQTTTTRSSNAFSDNKNSSSNADTLSPSRFSPYDSSEYSEMDYLQVESLFHKAGFENILLLPIDDIDSNSNTADGTVKSVTIDGEEVYTSQTEFQKDSKVIINYHNIPKLSVPISSDTAASMDYIDVAKMMFDSGFANLEVDEVYDLEPSAEYSTILSANGTPIDSETILPFDSEISVIQHFPVSQYTTTITIDFRSNLLFNKYDVIVSLDDLELGTLSHGQGTTYQLTLPVDNYTLSFLSAKDNKTSGSIDFYVNSETTATYHIMTDSNDIEVKETAFKQALNEHTVLMPFSSFYYLRKDYQSVVDELKALGFTQVTAKATSESFWAPDTVNSVVRIEINNKPSFAHDDLFTKTDSVTVFYHIADFKFDQSFISVTEKDTFSLPYSLSSGDNISSIEFKIDNPELLQLNDDGTFTALAPGKAMITASSGGHTYSRCIANINEIVVPIEKLEFSSKEIELSVGTTFNLDYTAFPEATNRWDMNVVTSNDLVECKKNGNSFTFYSNEPGDTEISFYQDNRLLGSCIVHAVSVEIEDLSMDEISENIVIGQSTDLVFTLSPESATNKGITVVSSNSDIVEVAFDERGKSLVKVTGKSVGEATITITIPNGTKYTRTILVKEVDPTRIAISNTVSNQHIEVGTPILLRVSWAPTNTSIKELKWSSSDNKVIKIDADGNLEAVGVGTVEITATHKSGLSGNITLIVEPTPVTALDVYTDRATPDKLYSGDSFILTASVYPENATDKTITFSSNDESVAKVSENGKVTAVSPGTTDIIVTTPNGMKKTIPVTVSQSPQKFKITYSYSRIRNDSVGNNWYTSFLVNDEAFYSGSTIILDPGSSFTVAFYAEERDKYPDVGSYYEKITYSDELCKNGYSISTEVDIREDRGRYAGNTATYRLNITITPIR